MNKNNNYVIISNFRYKIKKKYLKIIIKNIVKLLLYKNNYYYL